MLFLFLFCSRNRSFHHTNLQISFASIEIKIFNKIFNKIFILVAYIYLSFFRIFSVFEFISSRLSHLLWNFQRQSWSNRYLSHNQWIFSQCRSIEEMNNRFETKFEKKKKIVLRTCFEKSVDKILFYQREFIWKLARFRTWCSQSTFGIRSSVHICSLDQIFSLCYLFSRHAFYNFCNFKYRQKRIIHEHFDVFWSRKDFCSIF